MLKHSVLADGGWSGMGHPAWRGGPCRAGTPFTLADAPAHCRPIWSRSRVHYDSLSCLFIWLASYMLCTTLTDPIFHPHTPFSCSFFFFKFMNTSAPQADKNNAIKPSRAAATFLFFLHRIVTILINGYSNAVHYNHKYDLQTTAEHENESRTSSQVTHFQIPYIFETSR